MNYIDGFLDFCGLSVTRGNLTFLPQSHLTENDLWPRMGLVRLETAIHSDLKYIQVDSLAVRIRFVSIIIKLRTLNSLVMSVYLYVCLYVQL